MNKVVLSNVEPFNDIFFKSCFYNSFFPVVTHFNKSISPFLINHINVYTYITSESGVKLSSEFLECKTLDEILDECGIIMETKNNCTNIIESIEKSIIEHKPVIIYIDCYYESLRKDSYGKENFMHSLLIYGYDQENKTFIAMENFYNWVLDYKEVNISYQEVENCYKGYINNIQKKRNIKKSGYYEFYQNDKNSCYFVENYYLNQFKSNILQQSEKKINSLEYIKMFAKELKIILLDQELLKQSINEIIEYFNIIIYNKKSEAYTILKMFPDENEIKKILNQIIEAYSFIRIRLVKCSKYSINKSSVAFKCSEKLLSIYELEYELNEKLFNLSRN